MADGKDKADSPEFRLPGRIGGRPGSGGASRWLTASEKPKDFWVTMARLWGYFGKERRVLAIIYSLVIGSTFLGLAAPYLIGKIIDAMWAGRGAASPEALRLLTGALLAAFLLDFGLNLLQGWLMAGVSQRIVLDLRKTLFAKLQRLPVSFFDRRTHGELMSRLTNDIDNISGTISQSTSQLMASTLSTAGSLVLMLLLSPILTLACLVTVPLVFLLTKTIAARTRLFFHEQQKVLGQLNGQIEESISGIQVVKAFHHETQTIAQFEELNGRLCGVGRQAQIWAGFLMPLMNVINNLGFVAVAGVGGFLAVRNLTSVGVIASFLSYSRQFVRPLNDIANIFNALQTAVAGAERVFEILDEPEEAADPPGAVELSNPKGEVVFENVSFGYGAQPILKGVNFYAGAGSSTALAGPTGAGKTTLVNLLARFYDAQEGRILIDGRDIRAYTRGSLRRCFGIVLQDTYLFSGTIKENIRYGRLDASDAAVTAAAVMANADGFIKRLPGGYDTVLSESGANLSQGQRQLLAIARAILADPAILILDEATSSIDTRTELHIQEAMLKLLQGRTSFIIAHRLSTIREANMILVMQHGAIVAQGRHQDLLLRPGIYKDMYDSQSQNRGE